MKILHICNDYLGSKVHVNLYKSIYQIGNTEQYIYFPKRLYERDSKSIPEAEGICAVEGAKLKKQHRVLFRKKIRHLMSDLIEKIKIEEIKLIHATTLFTDGALAYKLYKKYDIPYIISIRNTDVNLFLKLRPDLFILARNILFNSSKIIFISDSLKGNFYNHFYIKTFKKKIVHKSQIIYNGIDDFWIKNRSFIKKSTPQKILYVGTFDNNKNVLSLIKSFLELSQDTPNLELNLVGNGGSQLEEIKKICLKKNNKINYLGPIFDKSKLLELYRVNDIFAMVSKRETFGLVYLEAMSQNLPVLYTFKQGIDGVFGSLIGEKVNSRSIKSIKKGLANLINNYEKYSAKQIDFQIFDWNFLALRYNEIYHKLKKK